MRLLSKTKVFFQSWIIGTKFYTFSYIGKFAKLLPDKHLVYFQYNESQV
jgi:hypothetical protein